MAHTDRCGFIFSIRIASISIEFVARIKVKFQFDTKRFRIGAAFNETHTQKQSKERAETIQRTMCRWSDVHATMKRKLKYRSIVDKKKWTYRICVFHYSPRELHTSIDVIYWSRFVLKMKMHWHRVEIKKWIDKREEQKY